MSKKVLMIVYHFPPSTTVGVNRTVGFVKNLPKFGWEPIVLTVHNSNVESHPDNEFSSIKVFRTKELKLDSKLIRLPDSKVGWLPFCYWAARKIIKQERPDVIYVSCPPYSPALVATRFKKPVIVDYRDDWTAIPEFAGWREIIAEKLERNFLSNAFSLISSTKTIEKLYKKKKFDIKFKTIFNGYNAISKPTKFNSKQFIISYLGNFDESRNPEKLFQALAKLHGEIKFSFVCAGSENSNNIAKSLAKKYGVLNNCKFLKFLAYAKAKELMQESSLLYLKQYPENYAAIAYKTFDYLSTGIPILADVPEGDNAQLVKTYSNHSYVITSGKVDDIKMSILDAYNKWKKGKLKIKVDSKFIKNFNWEHLTKQLVGVFEQAVKNGNTRN